MSPQRHLPSPSRRVLVVEDNPDGREMMRLFLGMSGHRVEVAADGLDGLHKALAFRPEVAILDIGLPLLDGYELARRIRDRLGEDVLLIALTGYGSDADRREALAAGFDVHLVKPGDPAELARLVRAGRSAVRAECCA